jgi:hypothetical protein
LLLQAVEVVPTTLVAHHKAAAALAVCFIMVRKRPKLPTEVR